MKGFFSKDQITSANRPQGNQTYSCVSCGLYKNVISPRMKPYGRGRKGILNIGEAPGQWEDKRGKPWQGPAGKFLKRSYSKLGIDLFEDCWNINVLDCRPTTKDSKNRPPSDYEMQCCRSRTLDVVEQLKPNLIVVFGGSGIQQLLEHRWGGKRVRGITRWRGWIIPDRELNAWVCPTHHPSFILRMDSKESDTIFMNDLENALAMYDVKLPAYTDESQLVEVIDDLEPLEHVNNLTTQIAIDYETTGIKPYRKGHRIVMAAVSTSDHCYAFMMPKTKKARQPFIDLLQNPRIGKIAHNLTFETLWSKVRLQTDVNNWAWDSMLAAHVLDTRDYVTGLKFQTYVNFGVSDYSSHVAPYLKSTDGNSSNDFNHILEYIEREGPDELLTYCGLDTIYTYELAQLQYQQLGFHEKL